MYKISFVQKNFFTIRDENPMQRHDDLKPRLAVRREPLAIPETFDLI